MSPSTSQPETAGLSLPQPELPAALLQNNEELAEKAEAAAAPERAATPLPPIPAPPLAAGLPLPSDMPATSSAPSNAKAAATSLTADDDLIEREWVEKAKRIVESTRDDPHRQSENLNLFKADYIKKHYGKTIKVSR